MDSIAVRKFPAFKRIAVRMSRFAWSNQLSGTFGLAASFSSSNRNEYMALLQTSLLRHQPDKEKDVSLIATDR